ncbi:MAG: sigma-54-dependent Fis family transcriptional regulator [Ignavibacteriae bacterium]|nr:MAG: sigma-54-dependent Fis family transcriptional regulator [Ignavibacteriota bacterium]
MLFHGIIRVLLIEDEDFDVRRVRNTIRPFSDQIQILEVVSNGDAALKLLGRGKDQFDVVIMDMQIAGRIMGDSLIHAIKKISSSLQIIVITKMTVNITDFEFANKLLNAGAFWYCTKYPTDIKDFIYQPTDFIISIVNAYQRKILEREQLRAQKKLLHNVEDKLASVRILGISEHTQRIRSQIKQLSTSDATVLITGPTGTGKELVATNIHYESKRKFESFVPINCSSIPHELIESELFGYEKGAFTNATTSKPGLFEVAHHGTLFLDEIGDLPLEAQSKLLRVIEGGEIAKIGRTDKIKVDVRIIAATNKILQQEVQAGRFREDLFYRLNVVPIYVSLLKDRPEDILVLWDHYIRQISIDMGKTPPVTEEGAFDILKKYSWPGNVRELKNVAHRVLLNNDTIISVDVVKEIFHLQSQLQSFSSIDGVLFPHPDGEKNLWDMEKYFRKKYFEYMRKNSSSDAETARKLGLAPPNYHRLCKELGLK